ncbi:MAG: PAS domain S-box protein [Desulfobulbus sp.]|nr:PAS domain S-box protein [Desulfobulbus sp.]
MNYSSVIGLVNNAALLLALCLLYDMLGLRFQDRKSLIQQFLTGIVLGAIGLVIMSDPWDLGQGVVFDTRSVLLVISGFFFGTIPVVLAVLMTGIFRFVMGGAGVWTGLGVIVTSGAIGLLWRYYRRNTMQNPSIGDLYLLGIVVHVAMLGWMFLLPWQVAIEVLSKISLPVMLIYPVATAILGNLMIVSEKRRQAQVELRESEARMRAITDSAHNAIIMMDPNGLISYWNPAAERILGYTRDEAIGIDLHQLIAPQRYHGVHNAAFAKFKLTGQGAAIDATLDLEANHKNGHEIDIELSLSALYLQDSWHSVGIIRDVTERKQGEAALRASEEDLKESQRIAHVGSWRLDLASKQVVWSEELYRIYGFEPALFPPPYTERQELFKPESWDRLATALQNTKDTGISCDLELEILRVDGSPGWIWVHCMAVLDTRGLTVGLRGVAQDITGRKQVEEALRESETRFKALHNASFGGIAIHDKGIILECNQGLSRMTGYSIDELTGMNGLLLISEKTRDLVLSNILSGYEKPYEALGVRKNNEEYHLRLEARNIPYKGKNVRAVEFRDITEHKQAEELIQKRILSLTQPVEATEVKFEALFNLDEIQRVQDEFALATGVASFITGIDGTPITKPSNFCYLCSDIIRKTEQGCANCFKSDAYVGRYNPDGPIVQTCLSGGLWDAGVNIIVGGHHIANWLIGQVRNETQSEDKMRVYATLIGADEEAFMQAFRAVPTMSVEQFSLIAQALFTLVHQLCTTAYQNVQQARFISERKQGEQEKEKLEEQLRQAQKMEAIGQLAGGVAHDFNNMLGVIIGYSELILEQVGPSQQFYNELEEIRKSAQRSADLTRQLLTFARKQTVALQVLDLNQTVEGMLNMLRRLIGENIKLMWMPGANLWPIKMDPSQIDQILANLCVNARDAIAGVGEMTIETGNAIFDEEYCDGHAGAVPGEYVRIAVSDNGKGMDKAILAHIFEPFFTTKGIGEGTGLGLATVYGAVKQNNGFVNAYSESGLGTTFTIYIPRHIGKATQLGTGEVAEYVPRGDEVILLVEDEPTILDMVKTMLEHLGFTVLAAGAPSEAIHLASNFAGQIHLLMTDVIMPEKSGRDLAESLVESRPEMKRLFMSGYTANIIAEQGVLEEGVLFIQKPFSKKDLAAKVREALESFDTIFSS